MTVWTERSALRRVAEAARIYIATEAPSGGKAKPALDNLRRALVVLDVWDAENEPEPQRPSLPLLEHRPQGEPNGAE